MGRFSPTMAAKFSPAMPMGKSLGKPIADPKQKKKKGFTPAAKSPLVKAFGK